MKDNVTVLCGHCKRRKAVDECWATGGAPQYKYLKSPLIFRGKPICEKCFLKDEQPSIDIFVNENKPTIDDGGHRTGFPFMVDGVVFRKLVHRGMTKVMLEVREHEKRKAGIK